MYIYIYTYMYIYNLSHLLASCLVLDQAFCCADAPLARARSQLRNYSSIPLYSVTYSTAHTPSLLRLPTKGCVEKHSHTAAHPSRSQACSALHGRVPHANSATGLGKLLGTIWSLSQPIPSARSLFSTRSSILLR